MGKLRELIIKHCDILSYLFFGGLTTVVNYLVYLPCYNWLNLSAGVSNAIAWAFAVAFAFLTNKPFVFKSHDWRAKTVFPELGKFVGSRVVSFLFAEAFMAITVDWLKWDYLLMKIIVSVVVVVLNYIGSKLLVFRKKDK